MCNVFTYRSSLLELVERPPILGKELERFSNSALTSFRVRPGPLPPNASKLYTALIDPPPVAPSPLSVPASGQSYDAIPSQNSNSVSARPIPSTPLTSGAAESKPTIRSAPTPVSHPNQPAGNNTQVVFTQSSMRPSSSASTSSHHTDISRGIVHLWRCY